MFHTQGVDSFKILKYITSGAKKKKTVTLQRERRSKYYAVTTAVIFCRDKPDELWKNLGI